MPLIEVCAVLIVVGVLLWLVNTYVDGRRSQVAAERRRAHRFNCLAPEDLWTMEPRDALPRRRLTEIFARR
jgi:hypothetical protein